MSFHGLLALGIMFLTIEDHFFFNFDIDKQKFVNSNNNMKGLKIRSENA